MSYPCDYLSLPLQALNEALIKAFPEYPPHEYPWPGHEEKMKVGEGGREGRRGGEGISSAGGC
jgi:hypothetical protein